MNTLPSELAKIGPYRISELIGEGGMGVVYRASAPDGREVSVKTLRPWLVGGTDGRRRFEREVATLRRVRGAGIAEVIDADVEANPPYVVTQYVHGTSLTALVGDDGLLRGPDLLSLARGLIEALRSVHVAGVVHRDVKPANVIMSGDGPVLIDFGIAHATEDTRLTATGFVSGTPGYLAPETVLGRDPTASTDIHGWAATVVFAATGRPPYGSGPDIAVFDRIRRGEHDIGDVEPTGLADLLAAALQVDPAARPDIDGAISALDTIERRDSQPDAAATMAMPPAPPEPPRRDTADTDETAVAASVVDTAETYAFPAVASSTSAPPPPPRLSPMAARTRTSFNSPLHGHEASVVLALGGALLVFLMSWTPVIGGIVAAAAILAGRVGWRIERRLFERRRVHGHRRNDAWVSALASPWDVVSSVLPAIVQALFALGCALGVGAVVGMWDAAGPRGPYLCGALVATVLVWRGPGSVRTRRGIHLAVEPLNRLPRGAWIPIGLLAAGACLAALGWESYGAVWWPTDGPPELSIPFVTW